MGPWFAGIAAVAAVLSVTTGGLMLALGRRYLVEFTRPGVTVEPGTPQWGGWTFPDGAQEPPAAVQREVTFRAADGVCLRGEFWAQPNSAPTIIISHGFHFPSRHFRSVAALEYAHGANLLLFDYRGHGQSELLPTTCGPAEVHDLLAAVEVAEGQRETLPGQVYIHGFSMGAAVALLLPPHAAVAGIIADSSYARLDEMTGLFITQFFQQQTADWHGPGRLLRTLIPLLTHLTLIGGRFLFQARYRSPLVARPDQMIGSRALHRRGSTASSTLPALLLIHAESDPLIAYHHAHRLIEAARTAGRSIQVYSTPCAIHCGSYGHDPARYMALVRQFVAL